MPNIGVSLAKPKKINIGTIYSEEDIWLVQTDAPFDAQTLIDYFNKKLHMDVSLTYPISVIVQKNVIFFAIIVAIFYLIKSLRFLFLYPPFWLFVALYTFLLCAGGIVYGIINGSPWFKFETDEFGSTYVAEYFMKDQHGQWGGEGFIFTGLLIITSFSFLALTIFPFKYESTF